MSIRSFDIFDTLIARKCVSAQGIFSLVEQRSGVAGFSRARIESERALHGTPYQLDDIYRVLEQRLGLAADAVARLRQFEIDAEIENAIPIREHARRVVDGDLLITDMYLPEQVIRAMLAKCGIAATVPIYRSTSDKASGRAWDQLSAHGIAISHLGDNPHADGDMAAARGVAVELTQTSEPNPIERYLLDNGFVGTALIARAMRLAIDETDTVSSELARMQTSLNIPMLILATIHLRRHLAREGSGRVLFSSRDCATWKRIYDAIEHIAGHTAESRYLFTSRAAKSTCSPGYLDYLRHEVGAGATIADLSGTGLSAHALIDRYGLPAKLYFVYQIRSPAVFDYYRSIHPDGAPPPGLSALIEGAAGNEAPLWDGWEMLNYSLQGTTLDVARVGDIHLPVNDASEFSSHEQQLIRTMQRASEQVARYVADPLLGAQLVGIDLTQTDDRLKQVSLALWREIANHPLPSIMFREVHFRCNQRVRRMMEGGQRKGGGDMQNGPRIADG